MNENEDPREAKFHLEDGSCQIEHHHTIELLQEHHQQHHELIQDDNTVIVEQELDQQQQHLVEIFVTASHSPGNETVQEMELGSLNDGNSEIVVMNHNMDHNLTDNNMNNENEIVTVVPMINGHNLEEEIKYSVQQQEQQSSIVFKQERKNNKEHDLRSRGLKIYQKSNSNNNSNTYQVPSSHINNNSHHHSSHQNESQNEIVNGVEEEEDEENENDEDDDDDIVNTVQEIATNISSLIQTSNEISDSDDDDDDTSVIRKCIVCLRQRKFTEAVYDPQKQINFHAEVLLAHLPVSIKKILKPKATKATANLGLCPECMDQLQRWHIFNSAVLKRHESAIEANGEKKVVNEPIPYESFEARVYRNYKKMGKVKDVFLAATHTHYARRKLTEKDWDFFCDHLFHSNSVKSEKSRELERFLMSREKLSQLYCIKCQKLIPNGKRGYTNHLKAEHPESPVVYPCDICGLTFPEKDMTASTEDYYPHWISHFYFNKCDDCGKRFPTKRALGQHRHAVHKNRQVSCQKCGKVLANKMSLDLHLLRHLPDSEKKKYMIKCKICKKKILNFNLKSHMATHNSERPWKCDHCDATFKMKGALVSHRDVVHFNLKNHVCSICNEAFKSASSLRGHVRRHEGRKDYKCDVCLKEYYTYSALKGHKVVHQTARNFVCLECGKAFKKKKALEEHGTIHTGEKRHICPICGREIRVKSNLYKHMKIHKKMANEGTNGRRGNNQGGTLSNSNSNIVPASTTTTIVVSTNDEHLMVPNVANIISTGRESMNSGTVEIEINDPSLLTNNNTLQNNPQQQQQTIQATFLTPHFQTSSNQQTNTTMVHTLNLQHQHQDLLNVYNFGPLQN